MYQLAENIIHIQAKDFKEKNPIFIHSDKLIPTVIWVHADISIPDFLKTPLWANMFPLIVSDQGYAIITEWKDPMQMSLKNLQIR